ncbi:H-2 class I histocompatibility antigen, alpha chain isoform X2 [Alosa alosa]|uniref:H-2 class I histocompatibility antigen, alpha chain isoform X2 n=1 Tax=Alosa alosa TaxID=278164 RepID=UPI0020151A3B|nr:H-2 class I histocompatibility antigen, alpha chain isoform X2 [Alosa alosa]
MLQLSPCYNHTRSPLLDVGEKKDVICRYNLHLKLDVQNRSLRSGFKFKFSSWSLRNYEAVSILAYTRLTSRDSVEQGVLVLVNEAVFAYFNATEKTFLLRPTAMAGFSVLEAKERMYCVSEVINAFPRQQDYLDKLIKQTNGAKPPKLSPSVNVYSHFPAMPGSPNYLYCYATGFYPGDIEISFVLNGRPFPGPTESSDLVYGEDWTFRVFKYISILPLPGEVYECFVNHSSLAQPKITVWRPEVSKTIGASVWLTAVVAAACGGALGCFMSVFVWRQRNVTK